MMNFKDAINVISEIREENESLPYIEILYVLEGFLNIRTEAGNVRIRRGQFCLFAPGKNHSAVSSAEGAFLRILYDEEDLRADSKTGFIIRDYQIPAGTDAERLRLKKLLRALVKEYASGSRIVRLKSIYYLILDLVESSCVRYEQSEIRTDLTGIIADMKNDPGAVKSQKEYADSLFISESSFSRMFEKAVGQNFREYVTDLRLTCAKKLLIGTGLPVTEIALQSGFGSAAVMQRHFRSKCLCTPSEYRLRKSAHLAETSVGKELVREILSKEESELSSEDIVITLTGKTSGDILQKEVQCIHAGDAEWLLETGMQKVFKEISQTLGIHYIAITNIFDPFFRIRREHETENLHFERLDQLLDMFVDLSCIPVLILPESRKVLIRDLSEKSEFPSMNYEDPDEWLKLFGAFLQHVLERYTYHIVRNWVFVIEHSPQKYSDKECADYLDLYRRTRQLLLNLIPGTEIWASSLNSNVLPNVLKNELRCWKNEGILPTALSLMVYPYRVRHNEGDGDQIRLSILGYDADTGFVKNEIDRYNLIAEECGCRDLPKVVTEWNLSVSDRTAYHDSCAKACHMLEQMRDGSLLIRKMFYRYLSDASFRGYDSHRPFIGAGGLLTRDGIKKPSWYAMEFWGRLGTNVISSGNNYIATTNYRTDYQILVFHSTKMSDEYKMIPETEHSMEEYLGDIGGERTLRVTLQIENVHQTKRMRKFSMSEREGSAFAEWEKMGSPERLGLTELQYLRQRSVPRLDVSSLNPENGSIRVTCELEQNSFALILID